MTEERQKSLDDLIKEVEINRLKAETEKTKTEKLKAELEIKEIEKNLETPWFKKIAQLGDVAIKCEKMETVRGENDY